MNKKFKIVSSIALAGMLISGSLGMNRVHAAEAIQNDYETNPVAVYRKLVEGRTVVPFVLANSDDKVTVKDLVESDLFSGKVSTVNGSAIPSLETVLHTGDRFTTTDGESHTIIVYGDVDRDGMVTAVDALTVQKNIVGDADFDEVQKEAADVVNDEAIDIVDALQIRKYAAGIGDFGNSVIDKLPPVEEVVEQSNYTLSLKDASYINNQNYDNVTLSVGLKETLEEPKDLKLEIVDKDGKKVEENVQVPAHTDFVENFATVDLKSEEANKLADGTLTVNLLDGDKIVGTVSLEKNTVAPAAARVTTNRVSTRKATLSLESMGTSNVTKVRYVVKGINDAAPTTVDELTGSVDVQNNKLTDATVAEDLATNTAYKVYYVVENQYGSLAVNEDGNVDIRTAVITSDATSVDTEKTLDKVTAPDLTKGETSFSWTAKEDGKVYVATLYKDGVAVAEKTTNAGETSVNFGEDMKSAGKYKVAVVVKGETDGSTKDSKVTESSEVTVTKLNAVEDLKFENREDGKVVLSWKTSYSKDDFASYDINVYTVNEKGELSDDPVISLTSYSNVSNGKLVNEVETDLDTNTIYVAKVKLNAKAGQTAVISSDNATSDEFYIVEAPNMDTATKGATSVTFTIKPINIANKNVTYKVKVYDVNVNNDYTEARYTLKDTRDVTLDKDNKITIDGLTSLNTYAFKLVAVVDGNEVESEYSDEIRTLPVIENLTVTKDSNKAGKDSGKIYSDGSSLKINGETYSDTELAKAADMVYALKEGDVVTINDKFTTISIKLAGNASEESDSTVRNFSGCDLTNTTVEIESNDFAKTIIGNFNKLVLKGNDAIYTVNDVNGINGKEPTIVVDGVEVVGDKTYNVKADTTAIINDVNVTTAEDVTIKADGKDLYVTANDVDNELTFVNETEDPDEKVNIIFIGAPDNTAEQKGKITIETKGGSVTVSSLNVNVSAEMQVEVTNGTATITNPSLTGNKSVTVSADKNETSKVVAVAKTKAPIAMTDIELKDYTDKELGELFPAIKDNQEKILAVREYINSFGINGKGAKITVAKNSDQVTITLPKTEEGIQDVTIGNLK